MADEAYEMILKNRLQIGQSHLRRFFLAYEVNAFFHFFLM